MTMSAIPGSRLAWLIAAVPLILASGLFAPPAAHQAVKIECVAGCFQGPLGGPALGAKLIEPFGVAFDKRGNWYICEYKGQRITKVDPSGIITLFVGGEGEAKGPGDAAAGRPEFRDPHGLVISRDQQMYVADTMNHRALKIDLKSRRATVVAGTGQPGYSGDGGQAAAATFDQLYAIDINPAGDKLYLTDLRNRRVRLLDLKSGIVTTIAGNGQTGVPADGSDGLSSPLVDPRATAIDSQGNVYILERGGNALRVLDRQGKLRTLIGPSDPPRPGVDLNGPKHLCVDRHDKVIIADSENHVIRHYDPKSGASVVVAGTGEQGNRIIAADPLKTQLNRPHGVLVHPSGALYISDSDNHRVLRLSNW